MPPGGDSLISKFAVVPLRQAIDAAVEGVPPSEKAGEHAELQKALEMWGAVKTTANGERNELPLAEIR